MIISIGALGGSGTRAIAEVFIQAGVFMGDDLNESNDNLVFSRLFKNPEWYRTASPEEKNKRLRVFHSFMQEGALTRDEFMALSRAASDNAIVPSSYSFYFRILKTLVRKRQHRTVWGWKEPNTQIYLKEILHFSPRIKYIHVLRHGLDMALSRNRQQLRNWGWKYGIHLTGEESDEKLTVKQLDYWIQSTRDVTAQSEGFEDRFHMLNHTEFCMGFEI
ncbi:MAG: sulfotransferase [Acidobacteriota bacterium]